MTQWEYLTVSVPAGFVSGETDQAFAQLLNTYGADGWELIAAMPGSSQGSVRYFFKRPGPDVVTDAAP